MAKKFQIPNLNGQANFNFPILNLKVKFWLLVIIWNLALGIWSIDCVHVAMVAGDVVYLDTVD